jgi:hypothetical protein
MGLLPGLPANFFRAVGVGLFAIFKIPNCGRVRKGKRTVRYLFVLVIFCLVPRRYNLAWFFLSGSYGT